MAQELDFVDWLVRRLPVRDGLIVGIGDDAAIVAAPHDRQLAVTSDLICDGVHFVLGDTPVEQIGYKALAVNLSDLAAMAAWPIAAFVSLLLPADHGWDVAKSLTEGMLGLAERFGLSIAGGDTNSWRGPLVVSITAIGKVTPAGPLLRSGAKPGDVLMVTGQLGGSILGHHLRFTPRLDESLAIRTRYTLHAGLDVSDGLTLDLARMTSASGCGAEIDLSEVPVSEAAHQLASADGKSALEHALSDGEDFELLLAVPPEDAERMLRERPIEAGLTAIGRCIEQPGLWQRRPDGSREALPISGYQHGL